MCVIIGRLLQERERTGHGLQCAVRLLLLLLRLNVNDDKYAMLEAAIGFEPQLRDEFVSIDDTPLFPWTRGTLDAICRSFLFVRFHTFDPHVDPIPDGLVG